MSIHRGISGSRISKNRTPIRTVCEASIARTWRELRAGTPSRRLTSTRAFEGRRGLALDGRHRRRLCDGSVRRSTPTGVSDAQRDRPTADADGERPAARKAERTCTTGRPVVLTCPWGELPRIESPKIEHFLYKYTHYYIMS